MKIVAEAVELLGIKSDISKQGNQYTVAELVVKYTPREKDEKLILKAFGEVAKKFKTLKRGTVCHFDIVPSSREFNGKWYTDVLCEGFDVEAYDSEPEDMNLPESVGNTPSDDLPF